MLGSHGRFMEIARYPRRARKYDQARKLLDELSWRQLRKGDGLGLFGAWYITDRLDEEGVARRVLKPIRGVPAYNVMIDDKANFKDTGNG